VLYTDIVTTTGHEQVVITAYLVAAVAMTLDERQGHSLVAIFFFQMGCFIVASALRTSCDAVPECDILAHAHTHIHKTTAYRANIASRGKNQKQHTDIRTCSGSIARST